MRLFCAQEEVHMAVSKIHVLYNTLGKAISYITNPDKTDGGCLVSSFGCSIETAAIEMKLTANLAEYRLIKEDKFVTELSLRNCK